MTAGRVESQIDEWRTYLERRGAVAGQDVVELEDHLRDQIAELGASGLTDDEAFLIAVKRMGDLDGVSREFAREHSGRLWKQLVLSDREPERASGWRTAFVVAVLAAASIQAARILADVPAEEPPLWLVRNVGILVLPFLAGFFAHRRRMDLTGWLTTAAPFVVAALIVNLYPWTEGSSTELLVAAHLPVALWFAIAIPYTAGSLGSHERRMDFVRFTGEWSIYYALIALGGGVLMALTLTILGPTGADEDAVVAWVLPSGAAGAVIVAAWLVEAKQRVIENMAPVLTMVFTPLFAVMLTIAAITYAISGVAGEFDRELLVVFDALMVVVLGLVLFGISARDLDEGPGWMDRAQLVAVVGALVLDVLVLGSMVARIGDLGITPNRVVALGLNVVLLVNLAGAAWLSVRFLRGRAGFHLLERWQTGYLPVFALWVASVVVVLPALFSFG